MEDAMPWRRTETLDDESLKWDKEPYRQGLDVVLAAGQVLAREAGFTHAPPDAPLLLAEFIEHTRGTNMWQDLHALLATVTETTNPHGKTLHLHFALAIVRDWHRWLQPQGRFARSLPGVSPGLLAMLGAGYLLEGMPNDFDHLPSFFALFEPRPSAWLSLAEDISRFCEEEGPYFRFTDPRHSQGPCFDTHVALTPEGMAFLGLPPVDTRPRAAKASRSPGLFDDADSEEDLNRERKRRNRSNKKSPPAGPPAPPAAPSPPSDLPKDLLFLEKSDLTLKNLVLAEEPKLELAYIAKLLKTNAGETPVLLFHGPPGTGKTFAAQCLSGELGRPLAVAAIDQLLIKWHGDTEKALRRVFQDAAKAGAVLLLDEADGILSDRGAMHMSWQLTHVNTLLKLLEAPGVPVVLCTNFLRVLDGAVHRRIHHLVEFPIPGYDERVRIWNAELARQGAYGAAVDRLELAEVPLTGGLIANAVRQFVRRAAVFPDTFKADTPALLALARKELPKMDREVLHKTIGFAGVSTAEKEGLSS
jgi:hypothetical protein